MNKNDNLLTLFSINTDLNMVFFIKKDESFKMAFYKSEDIVLLYSSPNGLKITVNLWNNMQKFFGSVGTDEYLSIAYFWANGELKDKLSYSERPLHTGIICGSEILTLFNNDFQKNKFVLPLDYTSNVLGVSRDSGDDAFIWTSSDEKAYVGVDMVDESMAGFLKLNLYNETQSKGLTSLSQSQIKQIGIDAAKNALDYFKSQGIDIQKGCPYLYVFLCRLCNLMEQVLMQFLTDCHKCLDLK